MSEQGSIQDLLKKGIEAAREGNKAEARGYFEQVVEQDEKNERAWFWLASVVETEDEKRICLKNVLQINPNNERAQKLMDQLEAKQERSRADEEVIPGITRRQMTLFVGGGVVVIVLIVGVFLALTASNNSRVAAETQVVVQTDVARTGTAAALVIAQAEATATQEAVLTLTPPATAAPRFTLPPTFTPTATVGVDTGPTPLPPPSGVAGTLVTWTGRDITAIDYLPIALMSVGSSTPPNTITGEVGILPSFSGDKQRVMYTRYFPATFDSGISEVNLNGGAEQVIGQGLPFISARHASYCPTSNLITFVAVPTNDREIDFSGDAVKAFQVYTYNIDTNDLQQITIDRAVYGYPAFSPDCTRIAVVRNDVRGGSPGEDIVLIDAASRNQTPVTTDFGNFVESAPRWSPDGLQLVYAAYSANEPNNNDIILRAADGSGTPTVPIRDPANDIFPIFSPDGRYIAFSSNRTGNYDIFVYEQPSNTLFQLTNSIEEDYPGDWRP